MTSDDDPLQDCELDPEAILGTHTFEDVLFTDDTETPVNVLTGETPAHSQATVEAAKGFAASIDTETPQIALPASVETQIETQSKPYRSAAFFHFEGDWLARTTPRLQRRLRLGRVHRRLRGRLRVG
jgi:hypothetical protein